MTAAADALSGGADVDLLFLACNRLEFTRETFSALLANTDWQRVHELFVIDDGSVDGTDRWLADAIERVPARHRLLRTRFGSPVSAMNHFIALARAPMLAKLDNDAMVPPGWLGESLAVFERQPELDLLGIEAMVPHAAGAQRRGFLPAEFISGLGLYRRRVFAGTRPFAYAKWFGLEEWQSARPHIVRGWIRPALPVFLLDRIPFEPWAGHSRRYVERGWQREWPKYAADGDLWQWWTAATPGAEAAAEPAAEPADFSVVILSARAGNLVPCVQALRAAEPTLDPARIVVVDDGARAEAEAALPGITWVDGVRPFIFSRNANRGLARVDGDAVLLNDDALLETPGGFAAMLREARARAGTGIVSAAVRGVVGNPNQQPGGAAWRLEPRVLSFVCVGLPAATRQRLGPLDERFEDYGFEDNDYCARASAAGMQLAVTEACVVRHDGSLPSTFRTRPDIDRLFRANQRRFDEKWQPATARRGGRAPARFVAALRIRNEALYIDEVIASVLPLCEQVFVLDDHSTDDTVARCRAFGERVTVTDSPFDGLDEARDKNHLLARIVEQLPGGAPCWVLWIDGDEVLERNGPARIRQAVGRSRASVYSLRIAYLWDDPARVRVDGIYGRFSRPSLFRIDAVNARQLRFAGTGHGGNLHCGNVPVGVAGPAAALDVRLKHYGYLSRDLRRRKYEWYTRVDPDNQAEDCYRHLAEIPGARHAPGPARIVPWVE